MVVFILCPECSEDISEIYPFYSLVKNRQCEEIIKNSKVKIDVDKIDFKLDIFSNFEFILEALHINNMCCRLHIIGNTDFDSLYI